MFFHFEVPGSHPDFKKRPDGLEIRSILMVQEEESPLPVSYRESIHLIPLYNPPEERV